MKLASDFGYFAIFGCVFLEQIGIPIPSFPMLFAAGVFVSAGHLNFFECMVFSVTAGLLADTIWYCLGRINGASVLNLICRISWKPDICVSNTKAVFSRYGTKTLIFSKFIPGLSTISPPLAGLTGVPTATFLFYDFLGCIAFSLVPIGAGVYFKDALPSSDVLVRDARHYFPYACVVIIVGFATWRYLHRRHYQIRLKVEQAKGVTPDQFMQMLDQGKDVLLLDVRQSLDLTLNPVLIPLARRVGYQDLTRRLAEIPLDKPIVAFCDCPEDRTAVAAVDFLREHGAKSAVPLIGGIEAWRARGFETVPYEGESLIKKP